MLVPVTFTIAVSAPLRLNWISPIRSRSAAVMLNTATPSALGTAVKVPRLPLITRFELASSPPSVRDRSVRLLVQVDREAGVAGRQAGLHRVLVDVGVRDRPTDTDRLRRAVQVEAAVDV